MVYKPTLSFPGTILHPKRGRIDLCKLSQKDLEALHTEGCVYIALEPGEPPCEEDIVVKETPKLPDQKPKDEPKNKRKPS
jgi:hypothetical protein